eukprot:s553_g14.t1
MAPVGAGVRCDASEEPRARFGQCSGTGAPQYLLEALASGNLIPILSFERGNEDDFWSAWMNDDFGAFAAGPGLQKLSALERFNFLGQWMARAYVISGLGYSPTSFHRVIYESLVAGRADEDIVPECEWLAGIYGMRRPQELGTYGWQSCDEIQDPESGRPDFLQRSQGSFVREKSKRVYVYQIAHSRHFRPAARSRYTQESCYKPLYRSEEMWEYLYTEWGPLAPQARSGFSCEAPVVELVKGFRQVVSDAAFWKEVDTEALQYMVEGPSEVNVAGLIEVSDFVGSWTREQKQVLTDSLFDLAKKGEGVPPFQNTLNKLLRFFTGSFKAPSGGFRQVSFQLVTNNRCAPLVGKTCFNKLLVPAGCLTNTSTLEDMIKESTAAGSRLASHFTNTDAPPQSHLRKLAQEKFAYDGRPNFKRSLIFQRRGGESLLEQALQAFTGEKADVWNLDWANKLTISLSMGEDKEIQKIEWLQFVLQSVVIPNKNQKNGLECLKFGDCFGTGESQYLLEALPNGDLIPLLNFQRGRGDRSWGDWMSGDFGAFATAGLEQLSALGRFNFLGQWMARAYVISGLVFAPLNFHSIIYDSLVAGHVVTPESIPNAYQDRYKQESCYKPLYRSKEMWLALRAQWGSGSKTDDLVPFERAREYTMFKCASTWEQDFKAPVNELVAGFRQVISDSTFWKKVDSTSLKRLVEGDSEINVTQLVGVLEFGVFGPEWTEDQKQLLKDTLYELGKKHPGVPPSQNPLNKLLRFSTGLSKEPVGGFKEMGVDIGQVRTDPNITNSKRPCGPLTADKPILTVPEGCLTDSSVLSNILQSVTNIGVGGQHGQKLERLRKAALKYFATNTEESLTLGLNRAGNSSIFEQTRDFFVNGREKGWHTTWNRDAYTNIFFNGEAGLDAGGLKKEWQQLVLQSIVLPDKHQGEGLHCLKFGHCSSSDSQVPQYLLETLPSGDLIPILNFERGAEDRPWSYWGGDFSAFARGARLQTLRSLQRFNFLGRWLARAYVISGLGFSPASFHSIIYESLLAGHVVAPPPIPNAYKDASDEDTIPECEWLATILRSRRPQELETYGWQSCDEIQDPESGRYLQESCYKPLYRSTEMWEYLYAEWGHVAPQGIKADDLVPFERAREYTVLKCRSKWEQDFQAPVNAMVKGFRQVISDPTFWNVADAEALRQLVEGDSEVNVACMIEAASFEGGWSEDEKKVLIDTLHDLSQKNKGLPPFQNTLNKLLRFFTGSFKEPVEGFNRKKVWFHKVAGERCAPLIGKTCFNKLILRAGCLKSISTLEDMIKESVAEEGSHKEAEEAKTDDHLMEEQEQQRQEKFNHLVENSESLRDLAFKVSALPEPPVSFMPIKSNIYRYWALGGKKRSWLHYFGLRFVFLIQLVAPMAILRENYFKWDFPHSQIRFVKYEYGSDSHGVSHLLGRLLEFCFIYCIGLHSLSIIKKAAEENSMLSSLFDELKRRKDDDSNVEGRKLYVGRWSQTCLLLDCVMICYVITLGLVDMVAIFSDNGGPKDVVFDSLALLFIFHLHEVEGGLTFVSIQDFNERRVGELCARISQATDPEAEKAGAQTTIQQKLAKKRIVLRTQRRSALFFVTETLIYIILLLVPVFQLFFQDGLQARSNAISEGTLGAHIVQEEALLDKAMKSK